MPHTSRVTILLVDVKMVQEKQLNFFHCFQPFHMISRIFGLLPFTMNLEPNGNIASASVGATDVIRCVSFIAIIFIAGYFVGSSMKHPHTNLAYSYPMIYNQVFWFGGCITWIIAIALDMINRNRFVAIITELIAFDKIVRVSFPVSERKIY